MSQIESIKNVMAMKVSPTLQEALIKQVIQNGLVVDTNATLTPVTNLWALQSSKTTRYMQVENGVLTPFHSEPTLLPTPTPNVSSTPVSNPTQRNGPVYRTDSDGTMHSYLDGKYHSFDDKPSYQSPDGTKKWHKNGLLHRDGDKPAVIRSNGDKIYYQNDELHRDGDKPAYDGEDKRVYAKNGKITNYATRSSASSIMDQFIEIMKKISDADDDEEEETPNSEPKKRVCFCGKCKV